MLKKLYLSPLGLLISFIMNVGAFIQKPFMIYGYYNKTARKFNKLTRISSTAVIIEKNKLDMGDNCWVWHHSILDASNGIKIGEGCQIGAWVGIFTHGSHIAIRLLGKNYIQFDKHERIGYQREAVEIGNYTFVGASSLILPGVKVGKGCLIAAGTIVTESVPDYSIVSGNPAQIVGDTRRLDSRYFKNEVVRKNYFDPSVIEDYLKRKNEKTWLRRKINDV